MKSYFYLITALLVMLFSACAKTYPEPEPIFTKVWTELEGEYERSCIHTLSQPGDSMISQYQDTIVLSVPNDELNRLEINSAPGIDNETVVYLQSGEDTSLDTVIFEFYNDWHEETVRLTFLPNSDSLYYLNTSHPYSAGYVHHTCDCKKLN